MELTSIIMSTILNSKHHIDVGDNIRESGHWGVMIGAEFDNTHELGIGTFINSYSKRSFNLNYSYKFNQYVGVGASCSTGYTDTHPVTESRLLGPVLCSPHLLLRLGSDNFGLQTLTTPAVTGFGFYWRF